MKYLVLAHKLASGITQDLPFMFPEDVTHADMAAVLSALFTGSNMRLVSAGEARFDSAPRCFGTSPSLDLKSRGQVDGLLFFFHDFEHGLDNHRHDHPPHNG